MAKLNADTFWMVYSPDFPLDPTQYPTRSVAQMVARSLANRHADVGAYFYVLKAQSSHQRQVGMVDFIMVPFGIGAPCPFHGRQ